MMTFAVPRRLVALALASFVCATSTTARSGPVDRPQAPPLQPSDDDFDDVASNSGIENANVEMLGPRVLALRHRIPELEPGYVQGIIFGTPGADSIAAARFKLG